MPYEAVIGLEIHVQLNAATKLFCNCSNSTGERPNLHICPICIWLPGAVPQLSREALEKAVLTCLALHGEIEPKSAFDQKVYYYPDLPKGFQLSQHHKPLSRGGWLDITDEDGRPRRLRIHHIHMEEDVARLVHETEGRTGIGLVDFNRAGSPLVEIVTEPDMRGPADAMAFLRALRTQIRYAGTAECSMENGTMRCDANISLRPAGSEDLSAKVEVKNMNSIRAVGSAIAYEIERQTELLNQGRPVIMHTRLWDPDQNVTLPMRAKFSGPCIPDPTVPVIRLSADRIHAMRQRLPEMPVQKKARFLSQFELTEEQAAQMSAERDVADYFEAVVREGAAPLVAAQWIGSRLLPALKERGLEIRLGPVPPGRMAELLRLLADEAVNAKQAREILALMFASERSPSALAEEKGFTQITDPEALSAILDRVMADHPDAAANWRSGKKQAAGFLIGQAMRRSHGRANPQLLARLLERK